MSYPKNAVTPKAVTVGSVVLIATGAVQTDGCSVRVSLDSGAWGAGGGTLAYDAASGVVTYAPIQGETNGAVLMIAVYKADCLGSSTTVLMDLQSADNNVILANATYGLSALRTRGDSAWITATSTAVSDKTGFKLASDGLAAVTAWTVNLTGNLSGSVGSIGTGGIVAASFAADSIAAATFATGALTADAFAADALVAATFATGALTADAFAADALVAATFATDAIAAGAVSAAAVTKIQSGLSTHSAANVKTAIEAAGSHLALILADTGTDIPATIVTAQATLTKLDGMLEEV